ncbi:MAG: hypothetical protein A3K10_04460 [Bacteroidetes bacterium RIFCSPLOWO2_12_FULL_31_6]|nr:MAG: hypothetical protein A3K10_04460 [Bacteroidetes bacterium RIFCSPLOWO2_12_FULL_31_6]
MMNKKQLLYIIFICIISLNISAQKTFTGTDVFTEKSMVWYGLDFTHCKFIGQPSIHGNFYKSPDFVVKFYFKDWNMIPLKEGDKYDIGKAFDKNYIYFDIDTILARNQRYNSDSLIAFSNTYSLSADSFPDIIKSYKGIATEGIGVVYIVESYNSISEIATYYCIIFDVATKKILLQEKITGRARGVNLKTYWAGAFHDALEKNEKVYRKWKKGAMIK